MREGGEREKKRREKKEGGDDFLSFFPFLVDGVSKDSSNVRVCGSYSISQRLAWIDQQMMELTM